MTEFETQTLQVEILLEAYAVLMAGAWRHGCDPVFSIANNTHRGLLGHHHSECLDTLEKSVEIFQDFVERHGISRVDEERTSEEKENEELEKVVDFLHDHYRSCGLNDGKAVMIAGQPGAGKTALAMRAFQISSAAFINTDEYRAFHPCYENAGADMEKKTARFAGTVTERLIDVLSDELCNLIIEGTLRTTEVPRTTCGKLKEKGYDVELHVLLATPKESFAHTEARYELMKKIGMHPRRTEKSHHDLVVRKLPENLSRLYEENCFDAIRMFRRGENGLEEIYSSTETPEKNPAELAEKILENHEKSAGFIE